MSNIRIRHIAPILVILIGTAYWEVQHCDYVQYDDPKYLVENHHVQHGINAESIAWAFKTTRGNMWLPITWLSYMLDSQFYGHNPRGYHITNLLLHIANSLLVLIILARMTGTVWRSAFVAALFALHPLRVESVAWLTERKDVLSVFFGMLTIWAYVRYTKLRNVKRYVPVVVLFALGLMAKPLLVTLPFALLLIDYWPLDRFKLHKESGDGLPHDFNNTLTGKPGLAGLIAEKIPLIMMSAVISIVTVMANPDHMSSMSPLKLRLANAMLSYVKYLGKTLWPQNLAALYPYPEQGIPFWQWMSAGLFLAGISIIALRLARRAPYFVFGWFWFLGILVPNIGLLQVGAQAMADRFCYIPHVGLFTIISWGLYDLLSGFRYRKIFLSILAGTVIPILMVTTWGQVRHWRNTVTLFEHILSITKNNYVAHNNLGVALLATGQFEEALANFQAALKIKPNYYLAHLNTGIYLEAIGRVEEAPMHYRATLEINPNCAEAHFNLGRYLDMKGRIQEAVHHYEAAIKAKPDYADAYFNLGRLLDMKGRIKEAVPYYEAAIRAKPGYVDAHNNLGVALFERGQIKDAIIHYRAAIKAMPGHANAHNNLGVALIKVLQLEEAETHIAEALRIEPGHGNAQRNLDMLLQLKAKSNTAD